jgi:tetratricopeptide (TPR) repeat protein
MKSKTKKDRASFYRPFTDRTEPRKKFWDLYHEMKTSAKNENHELRVLNFHGMGGIGKTKLLEQLIIELNAQIDSPKYILFDFESTQSVPKILMTMRNLLRNEFAVHFNLFDLAYYKYLQMTGELINLEVFQFHSDQPGVLQHLLSHHGQLPKIDLYFHCLHVAQKHVPQLSEWTEYFKDEINQLNYYSTEEIYNNLAYFFALDLSKHVANLSEPMVIFFDSYERLVSEFSGKTRKLEQDLWIHSEHFGLIPYCQNILWVIAGRDRLKWADANSEWIGSIFFQPLGELSEEDSLYFLEHSGIPSSELRHQIFQITSGTPVYLDLYVTNYMEVRKKQEHVSIHDLGRNKEQLVSRYLKNLPEEQEHCMYVLACLNDWNIELLYELADKNIIKIGESLIEEIGNFSIIVHESDQYYMHRTVRELLLVDIPVRIRETTYRFMDEYFGRLLADMDVNNLDFETHLVRYVTRKLERTLTEVEFSEFFKEINKHLQKLEQHAKYQINCNVLQLLSTFALNHYHEQAITPEILYYYANQLNKNGNYQQALEIIENCYRFNSILHGEQHAHPIRDLNLKSIILSQLGHYNEAFSVSETVYHLRKKIFGESRPETINAMNNLANRYDKLGHFFESLTLRIRVRELYLQQLDEWDPLMITANFNLGVTCLHLGYHAEAMEWIWDAYLKRLETLGKDHPQTIDILDYLGDVYYEMGKYDLALLCEDAVLQYRKTELGADHPQSLSSLYDYGKVLAKKGDLQKALELTEHVLRKRQTIFHENNPKVADCYYLLSFIYSEMTDFQKAMDHAERALQIRQIHFDDNHRDVLESMNQVSKEHFNANRYDRAYEITNEIYKRRRAVLKEIHPDTLKSQVNLSLLLVYMNRREEAHQVAEEAFRLSKENLGENHPITLLTMRHLVNRLAGIGKTVESLQFAEESYKRCATQFGYTHRITIHAGLDLASKYMKVDRAENALTLAEELHQSSSKTYGENDSSTIKSISFLSGLYFIGNRLDMAEQFHIKLIEHRKRVYQTTSDPDMQSKVVVSQCLLACVFWVNKKQDESLKLLQEIQTIRHDNYVNLLRVSFYNQAKLHSIIAEIADSLTNINPTHPLLEFVMWIASTINSGRSST